MKRARFRLVVHADDLEPVAMKLAILPELTLSAPGGAVGDPRWQSLEERLTDQQHRLRGLLAALALAPAATPAAEAPAPSEDVDVTERALRPMERMITGWHRRLRQAGETRARLASLVRERGHLEDLALDPAETRRARHVAITAGWIRKQELERARVPLHRTPLVVIGVPPRRGGRVLVVAATEASRAFVLRQMLEELACEPFALLADPDLSPEEIDRLDDRLADIERRERALKGEGRTLVDTCGPRLRELDARVRAHLRVVRLLRDHAPGGPEVVIGGTIAGDRTDALVRSLEQTARQPHAVYLVPEGV
jgi:vacuolar-type H+-ATPase subunit I/STV1